MREEKELVANWFSRWEEELPSPEELMPLSQTLITPDLATAFDIPTASNAGQVDVDAAGIPGPPTTSSSSALKKPRLVWTPQLHKRFVEAVGHLGIKTAVPKTIMQLMDVDGLTRENVASHLQKYRLYLKRMQHANISSPSPLDAATDRLFAMAPLPAQLLTPMRHQLLQMAADHQHYYHHVNRMGVVAAMPPHLAGAQRMAMLRPPPPPSTVPPPPCVEDLGSGQERNGRRVLTLFPTGQDC